MKRLVISLALLFAAPASAQQQPEEYWFVTVDTQGSRYTSVYFADVSRIAVQGNIRRAWYWIYNAPNHPRTDLSRVVSLAEFDCAGGRVRYLQTTGYVASGASRAVNESSSWSYLVPDSLGEELSQFICASQTERAANSFWRPLNGLERQAAADAVFRNVAPVE